MQIAQTRPENEEQLDDYSALYRAAMETVPSRGRSMVCFVAARRSATLRKIFTRPRDTHKILRYSTQFCEKRETKRRSRITLLWI